MKQAIVEGADPNISPKVCVLWLESDSNSVQQYAIIRSFEMITNT